MEEYTLVVMAAGMGSRFGGLKQVEPMGPNGEFIMDYSIYDAIKAGFNKIVFVINRKYEDYFRSTIGTRIGDKAEVCFAFQDLTDLPEGFQVPTGRVKPWGTGQAIYSAREFIKGSFAVINADDFYGAEAFESLIEFLKNNETRNHYVSVCDKVKNTLSENGTVKRGIVTVKNGLLEDINESSVGYEGESIIARPLDGTHPIKIGDDDLAALNLFGFTSNFMKTIQAKFSEFLMKNGNSLDAEYLLPDVLEEEIKDGNINVYIKVTPSKWYGITYKEDVESVKSVIKTYVLEGKYPQNLWE